MNTVQTLRRCSSKGLSRSLPAVITTCLLGAWIGGCSADTSASIGSLRLDRVRESQALFTGRFTASQVDNSAIVTRRGACQLVRVALSFSPETPVVISAGALSVVDAADGRVLASATPEGSGDYPNVIVDTASGRRQLVLSGSGDEFPAFEEQVTLPPLPDSFRVDTAPERGSPYEAAFVDGESTRGLSRVVQLRQLVTETELVQIDCTLDAGAEFAVIPGEFTSQLIPGRAVLAHRVEDAVERDLDDARLHLVATATTEVEVEIR